MTELNKEGEKEVGKEVNMDDFVPKAELEKTKQEYNAMLGRFRQSEERIKELSSAKEKDSQEPKKESSDEAITLKQQVSQLQAIVQKSEERADKLKRGASRQAILSEMVSAGADPQLSELAVDSILASNGKAIKAVENDNGAYTVAYEDSLTGAIKPIKDYVSDYMSSDIGKRIVAPKKSPQVGGGMNGASGGKTELSSIEMCKLTPEQIRSGNYVLKE